MLLPGYAAIGEACPFRSKSNTALAFVKLFGDEKSTLTMNRRYMRHASCGSWLQPAGDADVIMDDDDDDAGDDAGRRFKV